jgi:pimeloyl-ACP methyl ester carboxylesterase
MRKYFILLLSILFLLTSCSFQSKTTNPVATNDLSTLNWYSCHGNFQCATMKVPIDYSNKSLGEFNIAVIRYRDSSQHDRIGSLVVNPGGPGASGVEFALDAEYIVSTDVLERYDIVGFDPRGVGESSPIQCLSAKELDEIFASDAKPDNNAEYAQALKNSQDYVNKCLAKTPNISHYSTQEAAKDMDVLRAGLGDKKLNYMGFSYGTYLGTLYAQEFPEKVGQFILDGAIDFSIPIEQQTIVQARSFDSALSNFIADCHKQSDCPLPEKATSQYFIDLFKRVSIKPLKVGNRLITENLVVTGTAAALYDDVSGWPSLIKAIRETQNGDGTTFAKLADTYNGRNSDGTYSNNENDANVIISCLDWRQHRTISQIRSHVIAFEKAAPVLGPYVAYSGITCNLLSEKLKLQIPENKKISFRTQTPVLVIGTTQDPATPYAWAQSLNRFIIGSRLITLKGEGHTAYGRGSACVDDSVDNYLVRETIPTKNLMCTQ